MLGSGAGEGVTVARQREDRLGHEVGGPRPRSGCTPRPGDAAWPEPQPQVPGMDVLGVNNVGGKSGQHLGRRAGWRDAASGQQPCMPPEGTSELGVGDPWGPREVPPSVRPA